jgi:hypothetical protein
MLFAATFAISSPSLARIGLPVRKSSLISNHVGYYIDEATQDGTKRFDRVKAALARRDPQAAATLRHLPASISDESDVQRAVMRVLLAITNSVTFFAPNGLVCDALRRVIPRYSDRASVLYATHTNPVEAGYAISMDRPVGLMTGFTYDYFRFPKLFELVKLLFPQNKATAIVLDQYLEGLPSFTTEAALAAKNFGISTVPIPGEFTDKNGVEPVEALRNKKLAVAIALDMGIIRDGDFALLRGLRRAGIAVITDDIEIVQTGALAAIVPIVESPYDVWARQYAILLKGYDVGNIPVEQPTQFRRVLNLEIAKSLGVQLTRAQLASFDLLYSVRNKQS